MTKPWHDTFLPPPHPFIPPWPAPSTERYITSPTTVAFKRKMLPRLCSCLCQKACTLRKHHSNSVLGLLSWACTEPVSCTLKSKAQHSTAALLVLEGKIWCFTWNSLFWNCTQSRPRKFPSPGWHRCYSLHQHQKMEKNLLIYPKK